MNGKQFILTILAVMLVSGLAAGIGVVYKLYSDSNSQLKSLKAQVALGATPSLEDPNEVVSKVGKHILLPDEEPKIITLNGVEDLKREQPFFEKAVDGDQVLVYSQKVILYNPVMDKIIEIAQIRPDNSIPESLPQVGTNSGVIQ